MKSVSAVGLTNSADVEEIRSIASLLLVPVNIKENVSSLKFFSVPFVFHKYNHHYFC